jgi:sugar phosphate isomerase/epimerase
MLAVSTCFYDKEKYPAWADILLDLKKIGLTSVELDVDVPESWIENIKKSVQNNEVNIASIHNYCPTLGKYKYFYSLSSIDAENRLNAVKYTKRTIDLASELKAQAIVVHLGDIKTSFSGRELYGFSLNFDSQKNNRFLEKQKTDIWIERQKNAKIYLENVMESLAELLPYATKKNIKIGVENRPYLTDIPNIDEAKYILDQFNSPFLGYWHDVGHAEMSARLGYVENHTDYFENLQEYLIGIHFQDIKKSSAQDHLLPGYGDFDFKSLKPFINSNDKIIKVIEAHPSDISTDIKKSIKIFKNIGII